MNTSIEILDDRQHQELNIDFNKARRASRKELIPVVISEFHSLMFHYPIVFVKNQETGEFACSILLGVSAEANLLDQLNLQNDDDLPLNIRRLPFVSVAPPAGEDRPLVGINKTSPGINIGKGEGDYIFKQQSDAFDVALAALGELYDGFDKTKDYVKKVIELNLVSKLNAEIRSPGKPKHVLEGLYCVDINKVAQLVSADEASKNTFLEIATYVYAQNFSLYNMKKLAAIAS